ncbi:hypothetical protein AAC387_Pa09g0667 [Persea americana]
MPFRHCFLWLLRTETRCLGIRICVWNLAIDTIVVGVLHYVIDDTCENLSSIEEEFGCDVAKLVAGVSRLSYINQLRLRATTCFRPTTAIIIEGM